MQQLTDMLRNVNVLRIELCINGSIRLHLAEGHPMQVFAGNDLEDSVAKAHEWARGNLT